MTSIKSRNALLFNFEWGLQKCDFWAIYLWLFCVFGVVFVWKNNAERGNCVAVRHLHDADTLRGATKCGDFFGGDTNGLTLGGHHNDFFGFGSSV